MAETELKKIFIIAGPTASGKTAAAVKLAKETGGEVVSADSMQVYRGMNIGTAKPDEEERGGIPHHMLDVVDPDETFSAALYQRMAAEVIEDIHARGKVPILAGGTGFYINAVLYGTDFEPEDEEKIKKRLEANDDKNIRRRPEPESEENIRRRLESEAAERGAEYLHEQLGVHDPDYARSIHPNNVRRVVRALAFYYSTGKKLSEHNREQKRNVPLYDASFMVLNAERAALYKRIDERVLQMFKNGLVDEVRGLLDAGYHTGLVSMQGIGYKETAAYLQGRITLDDAVELIQKNSRHYAKRQVTWFKHQVKDAEWVDV